MMKKIISLALVVLSVTPFGYCADLSIEEVVDQYKHATDLQRQTLDQNFIGKRLSVSGTVENVGQYDFFDITNDTGGIYYKVLLQQQATQNMVPYQIVLLYKDKKAVEDINRGQSIEKEGNIIKIIDERLQIAIWIYNGEFTDRERELFK